MTITKCFFLYFQYIYFVHIPALGLMQLHQLTMELILALDTHHSAFHRTQINRLEGAYTLQDLAENTGRKKTVRR